MEFTKKYDMETVSHKYIIAQLEKSTIITHMICSFIIFFALYFILLFAASGINLETIFIPIAAGVMFSGVSYAFKKMTSFEGILFPIRLLGSMLIGTIYAIVKLIIYICTIKKCNPIIEEDKKRNPELYAADVKETVQILVGDNKDVSTNYIADEVVKYRNWLFENKINRDEYVELVRGIVKK